MAARTATDTQTAIFRAAAEEFAERGYDGAGVDRIAARAGVNKAMLYYHFGSKQGLYVEVLRDMLRAVSTAARAIAESSGTADDKLDRWVETIVAAAAARTWFPPIMLRELAAGKPHLDAETLGMMNSVFDAVRQIIEQGQREGRFGGADPLLTHLTILPAILIFFARQRLLTRASIPGDLAAPRTVDDFVRHMKAAARGMLRKDS